MSQCARCKFSLLCLLKTHRHLDTIESYPARWLLHQLANAQVPDPPRLDVSTRTVTVLYLQKHAKCLQEVS